MSDIKVKGHWAELLLLAGAAVTLAACGHDDHTASTTATAPPPVVTPSVDFETYVKSTFMNAPNTTPVDPSVTVFTFDVNNDPTAFDALLM